MTQEINEKLGAWLISDKLHTRDTLAELLDMTRPTLNGRLRGDTEWTWKEVKAIAALTGSTLDELAGITN
jgi:hypothetical protein